jgi:hypothetical protein
MRVHKGEYMSCKYSYQENKQSRLFCTITNDLCGRCRKCVNRNIYVNTDNFDKNCKLYIEKERTIGMTKEKDHKVLFEKRGMLAVELNDKDGQVVMAEHSFEGEIPPYVALSKRDGKYYAK